MSHNGGKWLLESEKQNKQTAILNYFENQKQSSSQLNA